MSVKIRTMIFFGTILWLSGYVLNKSTSSIYQKKTNIIIAYLCGVPYRKKVGTKSLILQIGGLSSIIIGGITNIINAKVSLLVYMIMNFITFFSAGIYSMIKEK